MSVDCDSMLKSEDVDVENDERHPSNFVHCVEKIWIIMNFI